MTTPTPSELLAELVATAEPIRCDYCGGRGTDIEYVDGQPVGQVGCHSCNGSGYIGPSPIQTLATAVGDLVAALEFYRNPVSWEGDSNAIDYDQGDKAAVALDAWNGRKET